MKPHLVTLPLLSLLLAPAAQAALAVSLPGTSGHATWTGLTNVNYPASAGYPGYFNATDPWPGTIAADAGSTLDANFGKVSGGGYFASSSLYDSGVPGTFRVSQSSALPGLATLIFQADVGSPLAGLPTLNWNGGSQALEPQFSYSSTGDYSGGFGTTAPSSNLVWQWDLSGIAEDIGTYEILLSTTPHGTIYRMDLSAGSEFVVAIPEPGSAALAGLALGILTLRRRRA